MTKTMIQRPAAALALLCIGLLAARCAGAAPAAALDAARTLATKHCAVCHTFDKGAPPGQGPNLFGIIGRPAGTAEGYSYSEGFKKALAGRSWDPKLLDQWLSDSQRVAPGNGMTYFQDDPKKRRKLIEFLTSLR